MGSVRSTWGTGSPVTICAACGSSPGDVAQPLPFISPASAPVACNSGLNSDENAGRALPSPVASTSRRTPVSCSAMSPADAKRWPGSGLVARRSSR